MLFISFVLAMSDTSGKPPRVGNPDHFLAYKFVEFEVKTDSSACAS